MSSSHLGPWNRCPGSRSDPTQANAKTFHFRARLDHRALKVNCVRCDKDLCFGWFSQPVYERGSPHAPVHQAPLHVFILLLWLSRLWVQLVVIFNAFPVRWCLGISYETLRWHDVQLCNPFLSKAEQPKAFGAVGNQMMSEAVCILHMFVSVDRFILLLCLWYHVRRSPVNL